MSSAEVLENLRRDTEKLHQGSGVPVVPKKGEYYLNAGESGRRPPESPTRPQYLKDVESYQYAISAFVGGAVSLESIRLESGKTVALAVNTDPQPAIIPESHFSFDNNFNNGIAEAEQVEGGEEVAVAEVDEGGLIVGALSQIMYCDANQVLVAA